MSDTRGSREQSKIWNRLYQQILDRGVAPQQAEDLSKNLLIDRGHLDREGFDTPAGKLRGEMSPGERAIERATTYYGGSSSDYTYNEVTNYATKNKNRGY